MCVNRLFLIVFLLIVSACVHARMYQWTDPDTGTTHLSGKPPSWYRSTEQGPRVIVFDKRRIIDDTKIDLPDMQRDELRIQAMIKAEEDMARAREQAIEAEQLKTALDKEQAAQETTASEAPQMLPDVESAETDHQETAPEIDQDTAEQMKALIDQWEQQKTDQARQKVGESESSLAEPPVEAVQ